MSSPLGLVTLPFRNTALPIEDRVDDLTSRLTLEEKAGLLFHGMIIPGPGGSISDGIPDYSVPSTTELVVKKQLRHFNLVGPVVNVRDTAEWFNRVQRLAIESSRLGIPITLSSDPRNHFADAAGSSSRAGALSQWPGTLGLAALRDEKLVERFADIARQEYLALGIRLALSPQADLSTEYRWARLNGTFGESAEVAGKLTVAYIRGFQAQHLGSATGKPGQFGPHSVSTMTKHFPGAGPERDGEDSHFEYGQDQIYPGGYFRHHLLPFQDAIAAGTRQMMPYYSKPVGLPSPYNEEVGFGFHKAIVTKLLREELGFKGIVCSDWGLVTDAQICGELLKARAWGVEHLTELERVVKIIDAGCDQLGGEWLPELIVQAVETGLITESRIDVSVKRLLSEKFELGLFESPYINVEEATQVVGREDFVQVAESTQRSSITLLVNKAQILPLDLTEAQEKALYIEGFPNPSLLSTYGLTLVDEPEKADIAILRVAAPYEERPEGFAAQYHAGNLEFTKDEKRRQAAIFAAVQVAIVDIHLDRPGAIPEVFEQAHAVVANYGSSASALLDVLFGLRGASPQGKLPFDLPVSTAAVAESREDAPFDTKKPVFRFGHGLSYHK